MTSSNRRIPMANILSMRKKLKNTLLKSLLVMACTASLPIALRAETVEARYAISLAGIPIGTSLLQGKIDESQYNIQVHAKLTGLIRILTGGEGYAQSTGLLNGTKPSPQNYSITTTNGKEARTIKMALSNSNLAKLDVDPPFDERPDRIAVTETHTRAILDPVAALVMQNRNPTNPLAEENCNRTLSVFDGLQRFDVTLSYKRTAELKLPKGSYQGAALVCAARYTPIAGYRPKKREIQFMANNKDIEVWLVPVKNTNTLLPQKISVRTMFGTALIEASAITSESLVKAAQ